MSVVRFSCPQCHAPLRLQNRALFVGRTFDCPDCGSQLLIEADGSHAVKASVSVRLSEKREGEAPAEPKLREKYGLVGTSSSRSSPHRVASESHGTIKTNAAWQPTQRRDADVIAKRGLRRAFTSRQTAWVTLVRQPVVLGWGTAAAFALVLLFAIRSGHEPTVPPTAASAGEPETSEKPPVDAAETLSPPTTVTVSEVPATAEPKANASPPLEKIPATAPQEPLVANNAVTRNTNGQAPQNPAVIAKLPPPPAPEEPEVPPAADKLAPDVIATRLQQRIVRFEQAKPVPFVKLLDTLEDLVGVPIVWDLDTVDDTQLQKPVQLKLEMTTVGDILDAVLQQVGLKRHIIDGKIELRLSAAKAE